MLQYEEEQAVASLQPSSLQIYYCPLGESESSQTSEESRETGDSGNFSHDEAETGSPNICQRPFVCEDISGQSENVVKSGGMSQREDASSCVLNICGPSSA